MKAFIQNFTHPVLAYISLPIIALGATGLLIASIELLLFISKYNTVIF